MSNTHELYGGSVIMEFNPSAHRYKISIDGGGFNYKQGTTTILGSVTNKDGLIKWAADMTADAFTADLSAFLAKGGVITDASIKKASEAARTAHTMRRDSAASTGTSVHEAVQDYIEASIAGKTPGERNLEAQGELSFKAFLQWVERHNPKFVASEQPVYSKMFDYCGTMDCLAWIDEKLTVIDFKTGNPRFANRQPKPYAKDFLQCAAYDQAYSEEHGKDADQYMLVYITKTGQLYDFVNASVPENRTAWHSALILSRHIHELDRAY